MTGIQPWRQPSEQLQLWKLSPGISKALSQGGCQYFQRMFTSKCLPEDGYLGNYSLVFCLSFLPMSWHVSQDFMLHSHLFFLLLFSVSSHKNHTPLIFIVSGGKETEADRSHYSFLVTCSSGAPQTEFIQPVPRSRGKAAPLTAQGRAKEIPAKAASCLSHRVPCAWGLAALQDTPAAAGDWHLTCTDGKMLH